MMMMEKIAGNCLVWVRVLHQDVVLNLIICFDEQHIIRCSLLVDSDKHRPWSASHKQRRHK